jgi:putative transposase
MGWELADNLKAISVIKALKMALKNRIYTQRKLIHHSDRGFQYCSPAYVDLLKQNDIDISMTTKYDPYENAVAERVYGILKTEYYITEGFVNQKDLKHEILHVIWLYNMDRPHLSCHGLVPLMAHKNENYELKTWRSKFSNRDMSRLENFKLFLNDNN